MLRQLTVGLLACLALFAAAPTYAWYYGGHYGGHSYYGHRYYGHNYGRHGGHRGSYYGRYGYGLSGLVGSIFGYRGSRYYGQGYDSSTTLQRSGSDTAGNADSTYGDSLPHTEGIDSGNTGTSNSVDREATAGRGWTQLADGQYAQALSIFTTEAQSHPTKGVPKVGYALAAAATGNLERGVWAMQRAFRTDPDSIQYIKIDERLRARIEQLIKRYQDRVIGSDRMQGAAFTVASLHYLLGDADSARTAIEVAFRNGDRTASTGNLQGLLETQSVIGRT